MSRLVSSPFLSFTIKSAWRWKFKARNTRRDQIDSMKRQRRMIWDAYESEHENPHEEFCVARQRYARAIKSTLGARKMTRVWCRRLSASNWHSSKSCGRCTHAMFSQHTLCAHLYSYVEHLMCRYECIKSLWRNQIDSKCNTHISHSSLSFTLRCEIIAYGLRVAHCVKCVRKFKMNSRINGFYYPFRCTAIPSGANIYSNWISIYSDN